MEWRFIDTGYRSAAENMALDDAMLECKSKNITPNTLRLLRFKPPAVLVGYHQDVEQEVRLEFVAQNGIDVNRRITGGGAIYFDSSSIGWEVIASKDFMEDNYSMEAVFRTMSACVVNALRILGIDASFRPRNDIEVNGRKISGTGGVEGGGAFLFQGTLLVDFDVETMIKALKIPIIKLKDKELETVRKRVTCLKWELGYVPPYEEIKSALMQGFEETLGIRLNEGELSASEFKLFTERLPFFTSKDWIYLDRNRLRGSSIVHAVDKKPGGVVRVALSIEGKVIKSALITGDFFAEPQRAILDIEAALKFVPCDRVSIEAAVKRVFEERKVKIIGITAEDIVNLILEAVEKSELEDLGLDGECINDIYPIILKPIDSLKNGFDYLLLPYCSKLVSCGYRKVDGCSKCGLCTIGDAYKLAEEFGLKPITIHNFEHLMETLKMLRKNNAKGFIGCCCEAFYIKHRNEMEIVDIPGIILDIENKTCYDLGMAEEAYKGRFEAQTNLKLDLLRRVLEISSRLRDSKCLSSM